jgi:hypothetical protein
MTVAVSHDTVVVDPADATRDSEAADRTYNLSHSNYLQLRLSLLHAFGTDAARAAPGQHAHHG